MRQFFLLRPAAFSKALEYLGLGCSLVPWVLGVFSKFWKQPDYLLLPSGPRVAIQMVCQGHLGNPPPLHNALASDIITVGLSHPNLLVLLTEQRRLEDQRAPRRPRR